MNMQRALILVKSKSQADSNLFNKVKAYPGVVEANMIYGPYDIYTLCQDPSTMGIKKLVMDIRNLPGVVSTLTCLISE
ncbi:MAG: Lrp/AsnC family transcriptional regulator [Candidatus Bathyarchaeota archaeon]|nr:Lrp/AsnC family transcriptional regulator [Candidatus Bathyarchaeota archaeon]